MVFYRSAATSKSTKPQWKTTCLRIFEQYKLVLIGFKIIITIINTQCCVVKEGMWI